MNLRIIAVFPPDPNIEVDATRKHYDNQNGKGRLQMTQSPSAYLGRLFHHHWQRWIRSFPERSRNNSKVGWLTRKLQLCSGSDLSSLCSFFPKPKAIHGLRTYFVRSLQMSSLIYINSQYPPKNITNCFSTSTRFPGKRSTSNHEKQKKTCFNHSVSFGEPTSTIHPTNINPHVWKISHTTLMKQTNLSPLFASF